MGEVEAVKDSKAQRIHSHQRGSADIQDSIKARTTEGGHGDTDSLTQLFTQMCQEEPVSYILSLSVNCERGAP